MGGTPARFGARQFFHTALKKSIPKRVLAGPMKGCRFAFSLAHSPRAVEKGPVGNGVKNYARF